MLMQNQDLKNLAEKTADRLRILQIDFSQEGLDVQKEYMTEEIERSLKIIHPEEKSRFLNLLKDYFPVAFGDEEDRPKRPVRSDTEKPDDPEIIISRFIKVYANLSPGDRQKLLQILNARGIPWGQGGPFSEKQLETVKSLLQLKEETRISSENLLLAATLMLEVFIKLESVVQSTWMWLNSQKNVSGSSSLRNTIKKCFTEGAGIESQPMIQEIRKFQQLITALITGIGRVGQKFSESFLSRYSSQEISKLVRLEGGGVWTSHNAKCWKKYQQLSSNLSRDSIEREICSILTDYIKTIMQLEQRK